MDPFTEKLLERTRARRENLQKKLSERPAAAAAAKRLREPLGETNSLLSRSATDQVPQASTKPSPSKRKCSGENLHPASGEENQQPAVVRPSVPLLSDRPTDKKPPVGLSGGRPRSSSSSSSSSSARAAVQPEAETMVTSAPAAPSAAPSREVQGEEPAPSAAPSREVQEEEPAPSAAPSREVQGEEPAPSAAGMKSRLQRLAKQRRCWDGDVPPEAADDCPPLSMLSRPAEVPAVVAPPTASSEAPLGRRGRLAHLAATIGTWEDHLSPKEMQGTPPGPGFSVRTPPATAGNKHSATSGSAANGKFTPKQQTSGGGTPANPQRTPASFQTPSSSSGPQKPPSSSSGPQKPPSSSSGPQKPPSSSSGPQKPPSSSSDPQKPPTGLLAQPAPPPAVKSFLEPRQDQVHHSPSTGGASQTRTPGGGASQARTPGGGATRTRTPGWAQDRTVNTSTADMTQRQKLERESELAVIRNRFQKGNNIWRNNDKQLQNKTATDHQAGPSESSRTTDHQAGPSESSRTTDHQAGPSESSRTTDHQAGPSESSRTTDHQAGPSESSRTTDHQARPSESSRTTDHQAGPSESSRTTQDPADSEEPTPEPEGEPTTATCSTALSSPPVCSSSPRRSAEDVSDEGKDSITSAVISQLFEGVLDQTEEEEEEEEDALNISSMSLLAPLAAVVTSPDRILMTSTPAHSFLLKNHTPDRMSRPVQLQVQDTDQLQVQDTDQLQVQDTVQVHSSSSDSVETCEDKLRLPYSIDAYRSTRLKETERPNIKQVIVRKEEVSQRAGGPQGAGLFNVKQKMKVLSSDMNLQQTVIHQASQALNCCTDEEHGKASEVEAEAERLLLVATERREALKSELDRLRGKSAAPPDPTLASRGSISLQELRLPLKADFVCSTANRPESTRHSFFILLRSGAERIVATPLASTHRGLSGDTLTFPTQFTLSDASSDFEIHVEVYCLVQKREQCTDKKKKNKSKAVTPKRFLPITRTAHTPVVSSPGGPHAVRTSNFVLVGSHKLSLSSIGKNKFPLEKVPFLCPLEGHVFLRLKCEVGSPVEERGFLTMFEDVSGFGAWHRRWCVLSGHSICYWTYPDDERRKSPIGRINLASCTSRTVEPASREFCARPNTLQLITTRPQREDDKETLVSQCTDTECVTKNWLSADTKEERNLWMKKLNQILTDLRMWQPDACSRPQ